MSEIKFTRPVESEKSLLSICMNYPEHAQEICEALDPSMLNHQNRRIFTAINSIVSKNGHPTIDNLISDLPDDLLIQASSINGVFSPPQQIEFHKKKIFDFQTRSHLRELAGMIPGIVNDTSSDTDEMVGAIESKLLELTKSKFSGYVSGREIALKTIQAMEKARKGELDFPMSGLATLDGTLKGFRPGKLYIVGARPGMGKTALVVSMMVNLNIAGKKVGMFSAEMDDVSISFRYLAVDANQPIDVVEDGRLNSPIMAAVERLGNNDKLFINDTPNISLSALIRDAKTMKRKENIDIIFVDYISLIKSGDNSVSRHERVGLVSKRLKQLARELEIPIVALSQLTRETQNNKPTIANIRYSGEIEEDADCIMLLWNEKEPVGDTVDIECIVAKNRGGRVGTPKLLFRKNITKYYSRGE